MAEPEELHNPWLVAVWPGMGNVAVGAGGYLATKLGARLAGELRAPDLFEIEHVEVKAGLAKAGRRPRNLIFEWKDPAGQRDLIIFVAEAQPEHGGYRLCHEIVDYAKRRNVERIVTFAAMATQLHPTETPRVFGAATNGEMLRQLQNETVEMLKEGQISGLNGVLLAAGAEEDIPGMCLLGELPYFAAGVPNPRASQAVLEVFASISGLDIDLDEIAEQAQAVEGALVQLLERLRESARQQSESDEAGFAVPEFEDEEDEEEEDEDEAKSALDFKTRRRIEKMFDEARENRERAFQLKEELDRLGVYEQYEDRFLDLFKKAE